MLVKALNLNPSQIEQLFASLQQAPGCVYLDSASQHHENSNFSVFAWRPKYIISADLTSTTVTENGQTIEQSTDDPLEVIGRYLALLPKDNDNLPFSGGAIGYFDYELGGRFETLPAPKASEIQLPNMYVGIFDTAIVIDQENEAAHFVSSDDDAERIYASLIEQNAKLNIANNAFKLTSQWRSNMSKESYAEKFAQVQEYLRAGDCYQINLAQRFSANYEGDEWQAYQALRVENAAPFSSFIRTDKGCVLSVSPERFLQVSNGVIETKPIKGTRPRSSDENQDSKLAAELVSAEKDRAENLMIVDLLRNDLSKVATPGSVQVPSIFAIESFPAVHHLVSTVTAKLQPPFTCLDLIRGAFPGGSITGAPKIRAMEIIHELEPHPRSIYCGAIGYIRPNGDMDTNITIRTLVCSNEQIHCWAGGGLVADSECDSEYQETLDKVGKILPTLANL